MIDQTQLRQEKQYNIPYHWFMSPDSFRGRDYYGYVNYVLSLFDYHNRKVLDAGSGDGRLSSLLTNKGAQVVGIDYSDRAVDLAAAMEPQAKFICGSIIDYDFVDKFDFIFLVEVLEHIEPEQINNVLINLKKLLINNGRMIITFPSDRMPLVDKHFQHFNENKIITMAKISQLQVDKIINFGFTNKFLKIIYKFLDNRYYNLKVLSKFFNKKIYPKFLLHPDNQQSERYIIILKK